MEVTTIGWICGGLILFTAIGGAISSIFSGESDVGEGITCGCLGGPVCLVVIVLYLLSAHPDNPFVVRPTPPPVRAVSAPVTRIPNTSRPEYLLSQPSNLELEYNTSDGSGNISWIASRWMPTSPTHESKIEYEIYVIYPDDSLGPYETEKTSYQFDYLNADNAGGVRIEVKAVGIIRDGSKEFRYISDVEETSWTPAKE